jgi:hypothetical protein
MSAAEGFRGYSPKEVAEMTGLHSEYELRRMARADEIAHHRGSRNKIVFFPEDIKALKLAARRTPAKSAAAPTQLSAVAEQASQPDPFRSTTRSRAAHRTRKTA